MSKLPVMLTVMGLGVGDFDGDGDGAEEDEDHPEVQPDANLLPVMRRRGPHEAAAAAALF